MPKKSTFKKSFSTTDIHCPRMSLCYTSIFHSQYIWQISNFQPLNTTLHADPYHYVIFHKKINKLAQLVNAKHENRGRQLHLHQGSLKFPLEVRSFTSGKALPWEIIFEEDCNGSSTFTTKVSSDKNKFMLWAPLQKK